MANRERGELRLATPTGVYTLRLTVGACCELETLMKRELDVIIDRVNAGGLGDARALLWAALQGYHSDQFPAPDRVGPLVDDLGTSRLLKVLGELMGLNTDPDPPPADKRGAPPRKPSLWRRLYVDARLLGLDVDQFWRLSLREVWLELAVGRKQHQRDRAQAWFVAMLTRAQKLPTFDAWVGAEHGPIGGPQTPQQMASAVALLESAYPNSKPLNAKARARLAAKKAKHAHGKTERHRTHRR